MILPILYFTLQIYTFFLNKQTQLQKNFKEFYFITIPPQKNNKKRGFLPRFLPFYIHSLCKIKIFRYAQAFNYARQSHKNIIIIY
jgi:hypothetical protein